MLFVSSLYSFLPSYSLAANTRSAITVNLSFASTFLARMTFWQSSYRDTNLHLGKGNQIEKVKAVVRILVLLTNGE